MPSPFKIAVLIGTRPEAIKMAPVIEALRRADNVQPIVISTGQHREMLRQVVDLFAIAIDHELSVMQPNQTLASLTARLVTAIDEILAQTQPDFVMAQGDTSTTFVAALASFYRRIPFGHVEAGLRTGHIYSPFPEEVNRRLVSPMSTLHFPPTELGRRNLLREGIADAQITITGNTVIDALRMEVQRQSSPPISRAIDQHLAALLGDDWSKTPSILITGHRRENFGGGFQQICSAIATLAQRFPGHQFIYPVHLNPNVQQPVRDSLGARPNIRLIPPQQYSHFVALMRHSTLILTDSGGIQEEAPTLGKPVLVMRDTTERPEGVDAGTVLLVGANADAIVMQATRLLTDAQAYQRMSEAVNPFGDGKAADRIVKRVVQYLAGR